MTQWEYTNDYTTQFARIDSRHFVAIEYDNYPEAPFGCVVPPTIYGNDWHHPYGELASCCKGVECPDWDTIRRALDHFGENVSDLGYADSVTARYLRIFYGARAVSLLTSSIDRYAWAIVLVTDSWLDHIGTSKEFANDSTNFLEVQAYLNGEVYFASVHRTEYPTTLDDYDSLESAWTGASDCLETVGGYYGEDWAREGALELGGSLAGSFHPTYSEVRTITTTITDNGPAIMSGTVRKVERAPSMKVVNVYTGTICSDALYAYEYGTGELHDCSPEEIDAIRSGLDILSELGDFAICAPLNEYGEFLQSFDNYPICLVCGTHELARDMIDATLTIWGQVTANS